GIGALLPKRPIEEVEADDADASLADGGCDGQHGAVAHVAAGAVRAHEHGARGIGPGRLPDGRRLIDAGANRPGLSPCMRHRASSNKRRMSRCPAEAEASALQGSAKTVPSAEAEASALQG